MKNGMKDKRRSESEFIVCLKNESYVASLERHKIYRVLADPGAEKDVDIRIVDESGEDHLYPKDWLYELLCGMLSRLPFA
jgi:hypothetical protein